MKLAELLNERKSFKENIKKIKEPVAQIRSGMG